MHANSTLYARISQQWLNERRRLWLSVPWRVTYLLFKILRVSYSIREEERILFLSMRYVFEFVQVWKNYFCEKHLGSFLKFVYYVFTFTAIFCWWSCVTWCPSDPTSRSFWWVQQWMLSCSPTTLGSVLWWRYQVRWSYCNVSQSQ